MKEHKLEEYKNRDFITIQDGEIRFHGYLYNNGCWRFLEYHHFIIPLRDFLGKYGASIDEAYEEVGMYCKQYLLSEEDEGSSLQDVRDMLDAYILGAEPIKLCDISEKTPNGYYVIE